MAAVTILAKYSIHANYAFMVGLPFETNDDMSQTITLIHKIKKIHPNAEFTYQYYRPYPGGELYEEALRSGYREPSSLREWSALHDPDSGFIPLSKLPWIKNSTYINYLLYAIPHSTRNINWDNWLKSCLLYIVKDAFTISLFLRVKLKFQFCFIELYVWNCLRKMRSFSIKSQLFLKSCL